MLFFFIVPLWLLVVLCGITLLFLPRHRRKGWYAISVSTAATLTSFLMSTMVLYIGTKFGEHESIKWFGAAVVGLYLVTIAVGGAAGGIAGFLLTRKLMDRCSPD